MPIYSFGSEDEMIDAAVRLSEENHEHPRLTTSTGKPKGHDAMSSTINLDLPSEYWLPLKVQGVSRDAESERAVSVFFTRGLSDDELRRLHEFLRGWRSK